MPTSHTNHPSATDDKLLISIDHVTVRHLDKVIFPSLSFELREQEQWALIGDSGSGKSALLGALSGKFNVTKGSIRYIFTEKFKKEHHIDDPLFTRHNLMAFVSQQAHFKNKQNREDFFYQQRYHAHFSEEAATVETYLKEAQRRANPDHHKPVKFPPEWIEHHLLLTSLKQKTLIQLSNGETRRLQIAYALLQQPVLLLLDNPFIGLDTDTRPLLEDILKKIAEAGTSIIMATTRREIPDCITHIAFLEQKEIKISGPKTGFKVPKKSRAIPSRWEPDRRLLSKIKQLEPAQNHDFKTTLNMEHIRVQNGDKLILDEVSWKVKKGEKWALTGPNGAGKSTLLSLLTGDHPQAYSNKIYLFDQKRGSGESIWELKKRIGFVSPEMHQYFRGNHPVREVVLSGLDNTLGFRTHQSSEQERRLAGYWLQLLGLAEKADQPLQDLATGEQRLILVLRAMIKNPPLLILDEPCQGLDEQQRTHFKRIIDLLWQQPEKTLLYVSHYKEDIPSCVGCVLELKEGKVFRIAQA